MTQRSEHPIAKLWDFDWMMVDRPHEHMLAATEALFAGVRGRLASLTQVSTRLPTEADFEEAELRGRLGDLPVRLIVTRDGHFRGEAQGGAHFHLVLELDPTKVPTQAAPASDWGDDERCVFLAKGLFLRGKHHIEEGEAALATMQPEDVTRLLAAFEQHPFGLFIGATRSTEVTGGTRLHSVADPVDTCSAALELLAFSVKARGGVRNVAPLKTACAFCGSRYFFLATQARCANCGAPFTSPG